MAAKRTRWVCPQCTKAILAPSRLRSVDPRRYCLPCSGKKGTAAMVERFSPAREKKRQAAAAKRSTRAERNKALVEAAPYAQRDDLIRRDFAKLLKLPEWRASFKAHRPKLDSIRRRKDRYTTGHCWVQHRRITVTFGRSQSRRDIIELLVHELVHASLDWHEHHGDRFKGCEQEMIRQTYEAGILTETLRPTHVKPG